MQKHNLGLLKQRLKLGLLLSVGLCAIVGISTIFDIAIKSNNPIIILVAIAYCWLLMFIYLSISYTREFIYRTFGLEYENENQQ
jgi:hypothetical protein